jgi:hypothetical protein
MKKKHWLILILVTLVVIQFIRIDKTMPEAEAEADFISITNPPSEIASLIKTSCYDCHSYKVKYPWYAEIAPISWYLKHHVNEGLERVNFSDWTSYSKEKAARKLGACAEAIEEGEMPLSSYTLMHSEARLSKEQQKLLSEWLENEADKTDD